MRGERLVKALAEGDVAQLSFAITGGAVLCSLQRLARVFGALALGALLALTGGGAPCQLLERGGRPTWREPWRALPRRRRARVSSTSRLLIRVQSLRAAASVGA